MKLTNREIQQVSSFNQKLSFHKTTLNVSRNILSFSQIFSRIMNSQNSAVKVKLQLDWLNRVNGNEKIKTSLTVEPTRNLDSYLEAIFNQTTKIEQSLNHEFIPCDFDNSKGFIELIRNGNRLCPEEYLIPISYFRTKGADTVEFFLNTRHCGFLILCANESDAIEEQETSGCHLLEFDFGRSTTLDLKTKLQETVKENVDYVYTESTLLVHPNFLEKEPRMLRNFLDQCAEVKYRKKTNPDEIGLVAHVQTDGSHLVYTSHVIFVSKQLSLKGLEEMVKDLTDITVHNLEVQWKNFSLKMDQTLEAQHVDDGQEIYFHRKVNACGFAMASTPEFADLTAESENFPIENGKLTKPAKGLNLIGSCQNGECEVTQKGISPVVPWKGGSFDLNEDRDKIVCPECSKPLKIRSPAFHLTQWKYFGKKSGAENNDENTDDAELLTCEWQTADDPDGHTTFTVVDTAQITVGMSEWRKLIVITQPLPGKPKKAVKQEKYNVVVDVSLPLMLTLSFKFDWFRDFFK